MSTHLVLWNSIGREGNNAKQSSEIKMWIWMNNYKILLFEKNIVDKLK